MNRRCQSVSESGDGRISTISNMPGMFEMVLVCPSPDSLTDWHRRFAELFEALYETGYMADYRGLTTPWVRFLPVGKAIEAHPLALPSDHLEVVLDQFDVFGVGQCQCRMTAEIAGRGCGKPKGNCAVMGRWAQGAIKMGGVPPGRASRRCSTSSARPRPTAWSTGS